MANAGQIMKVKELLSALACPADAEKMFRDEQMLMEELLKLSTDDKVENSNLTQPLHLYFAGLYHKGRISLDSTAHNKSIELFTDAFLEESGTVKSIFNYQPLQKVLLMLIAANLSVHRMQNASKLLDMYLDIFTGSYKAMLYLRILSSPCGTLGVDKIVSLFAQADRIYYDECIAVHDKANFLRNVYTISKGTGIDLPDFAHLLDNMREILKGNVGVYATSLFIEFCHHNEFLDETREWLDSLSDEDRKKPSVSDIAIFLDGRMRGLAEVPKAPSAWGIEAPVGGNSPDANKRAGAIRSNLLNKEYPLDRLLDDIDGAIDFYRRRAEGNEALDAKLLAGNDYYSMLLLRPSVVFWKEMESNYLKVDPTGSAERKEVFFFANEYSLVNGAVTFPFLLEARRRGIKCYSVSPEIRLDSSAVGDPVYELCGLSVYGQDKRFFANKDMGGVEIDLAHKRIIVRGMNVYQPIFEYVTRYQFTYFYDYENDAWARYRTTLLARVFNSLFAYIERIEQWAVENGKKVYFLSNAPHIHLAAAYRIYCEERGYKKNLNYICTSPGYDNYYLNSADPRTETTTALNLTKHTYSRNSFLGTKEMFEQYYAANRCRIAEIESKMRKYLEAQRGRGGKNDSEEKRAVLEKIMGAKKQGKTVILLNGKVIIDLAVKFTRGCVHGDMCEWITHAVAFSKRHASEILLLIKPHPHESREDLTLTSETIDTLRSIIKCDLGENTIYLDNDMFTNHELVPYMDLGLVWNGTSALEFAAQGKKVLVADVWGHYDYPIGFVEPKALEEYERYMLDPDRLHQPEELQSKALVFLEYMGSDVVRIPNPYARTTLMNFNQYSSTIDGDAVDCFVRQGGDEALRGYFDTLL